MIRIGIVGCGRILNAHLQGYKKLREAGIEDFRITALVARQADDACMFVRRGEGPTPRPPVTPPESGDPLGAPPAPCSQTTWWMPSTISQPSPSITRWPTRR